MLRKITVFETEVVGGMVALNPDLPVQRGVFLDRVEAERQVEIDKGYGWGPEDDYYGRAVIRERDAVEDDEGRVFLLSGPVEFGSQAVYSTIGLVGGV